MKAMGMAYRLHLIKHRRTTDYWAITYTRYAILDFVRAARKVKDAESGDYGAYLTKLFKESISGIEWFRKEVEIEREEDRGKTQAD